MTHARQISAGRNVLTQLYPWIGKAVHSRWRIRRAVYQQEAQAILLALSRTNGHVPSGLALRLQGFLGRLHGEWFPADWRPNPTYAEVVRDFHWWLRLAECWGEAGKTRKPRVTKARTRRRPEPLAEQPVRLLRLLSLPKECTQREFLATWRRFLKANHPDLHPDQTADERRLFKEAVALWRR